jgi:DNA ligase-1
VGNTTFAELAELGDRFEGTRKRAELVSLTASFLQRLQPHEVSAAVRLTIGRVFPEWDPRTLNVSWKVVMSCVDELVDTTQESRGKVFAEAVDGGEAVRVLFERGRSVPQEPPLLTILEVNEALDELSGVSGKGSRAAKTRLLREVFLRASPVEAKHLTKILVGEVRHGVSEGVMLLGIAEAAAVQAEAVRRANQFLGDVGEVAEIALQEGDAGLRSIAIRLFRPVKPMLAQTARDLEEVFRYHQGGVVLEYKLDGARVQIHRSRERTSIYTRNLAEVSDSLPDVVAHVQSELAAQEAILDGEVVAIDSEGRPYPFQHLMRRFGRKHDVAAQVEQIPVELRLFDLLYVDGTSLVDMHYADRRRRLEEAAGGVQLVQRLLPESPEEGSAFGDKAHRAGHEGLMAKALGSTYTPGARGKSWLKLKHVDSLDLVIVAADWGYGRRHGWLSNYHLAALDEESGAFTVVGKTFKGPTDKQFQEMTQRLLALEVRRKGGTVVVRPEVVVEVMFNEVQQSGRYESGFALRFARIARTRKDKSSAEADTVQAVRHLYEEQFRYKARRR